MIQESKISLVLAAAFIVLTLLGIIVISNGKTNDVLIKESVIISNIETVPFEARVEASNSLIWNKERPSYIIITLFLFIGAFSQFVFASVKGFSSFSAKDLSFIGFLFISWALSWGIIFGGYVSGIGDSDYEIRLTKTEYEAAKNNLDSLFE